MRKLIIERGKLPLANQVTVLPEFITVGEHEELLHWAEDQFAGNHLHRNSEGQGRYFRQYGEGSSVPSLFWHVRERAISSFSVIDYEEEPMYTCFLGCNTEGGFVHRHRDPSPAAKTHVRINIMLSKPHGGGIPLIEDEEIEVQERDLWCFYPSLMWHASTPVQGSRKRFVISIGILVPQISFPAAKKRSLFGKIFPIAS